MTYFMVRPQLQVTFAADAADSSTTTTCSESAVTKFKVRVIQTRASKIACDAATAEGMTTYILDIGI